MSPARKWPDSGFTLVETLVVILVLALLAAIAIPAFLGQREKAGDAVAKADARTARTAIETYATENNGSYTGASETELVRIEETLSEANSEGRLAVSDLSAGTFTVSVTSDTGNTFSVRRSGGTTTQSCETPGRGGCPASGNWGQ